MEITQDYLKTRLFYCPVSGEFTWAVNVGRFKKGDTAGSFDRGGYRRIRIDRNRYLAHRLAWFYVYGIWPNQQIDHINGNRSDNRIHNLRDVSNSINQQNQKKYTNNKSGVTGVSWHKKTKKWQASICAFEKVKYLGLFDNLQDAKSARLAAEKQNGFADRHGS